MARKLGKLTDTIKGVAQNSFERANEKKVVWIKDENLLDHPLNEEDLSYTEDIEEHIREEGFRYPITVTKYGCPDENKYFIISGHRARRAGRKLGRTDFPCIIEDYVSETDVYYALLSGNARRNRDPLDLVAKYMKWNKYLDMIGFKGNRAEKIAAKLGISKPRADKYRAFTKVIPEFWALVREKDAAKEELYALGAKTEEEQKAIYNFFLLCNPSGESVYTKAFEKNIIQAWNSGARTYEQYLDFVKKKEGTLSKKEEEEKNEYNGDDTDNEHREKIEEPISVHRQENVLNDFGGNISRKIDGHNDNEQAGKEFIEEQKSRYKEERLNEEEKDTAMQPFGFSKKDLNKAEEQNTRAVDTDVANILRDMSKLQMKLRIDNRYSDGKEAAEIMNIITALTLNFMSEIEILRDDYGLYDEYDACSDKISSCMEGVPFN